MKSIAELEAIRDKALKELNLKNQGNGTRIVVGMATCGIAAGARPVLSALLEEVDKRELKDVKVTQTGCIGVCRLEPLVEVYKEGEERVTYVNVTPSMVPKIVTEHIVNNCPVETFTIGYAEGRK